MMAANGVREKNRGRKPSTRDPPLRAVARRVDRMLMAKSLPVDGSPAPTPAGRDEDDADEGEGDVDDTGDVDDMDDREGDNRDDKGSLGRQGGRISNYFTCSCFLS
jgi:hypothetical protein